MRKPVNLPSKNKMANQTISERIKLAADKLGIKSKRLDDIASKDEPSASELVEALHILEGVNWRYITSGFGPISAAGVSAKPRGTLEDEISARLRDYRIRNGITQEELGEATGKSRVIVAHHETMRTPWNVADLYLIHRKFGLSLDYIILGKGPAESQHLIIENLRDEINYLRRLNKILVSQIEP